MFPKEIKNSLEMINPLILAPSILLGGQPSEEDFHYLKSLGVVKVINLRPTSEEIGFDQFALMQQLEFDYHLIVVADASDLSKEAAQNLAELLPKNNELCIFHCASGNRVGALLALKAYWFEGYSVEQAIQFGLDSGMTKLLPKVKKILEFDRQQALLTE